MPVFDRVAIDGWLRGEIVQKFPKGGLGDIKLGSQLIVNPGEIALFVRGGQPMGTFEPGRHTLTTENIPWVTDLLERGLFGGKNVFTADVYFIKTVDMTFKFGTAAPIVVEHPQRRPGASAIVGNGNYIAKVTDGWRFLNAMDAFRDSVREAHIKDRLDPNLGVMLQDKLSELAIARGLGPADLQSFSKDLNDLLVGLLQPEFDKVGMALLEFSVRFSLHKESLEIVTRMGYGTEYTQVKSLDVAQAAAENPSGSNLAESGIGLAGLQAAQAMMQQQALSQQAAAQQAAAQQAAAQQAAAQQAAAQQAAAQQAAAQQGATADEGGAGGDMPAVMTPEQAAAVLQVSVADVMAIVESGELKARKIGSAVRISRQALEAFLSG